MTMGLSLLIGTLLNAEIQLQWLPAHYSVKQGLEGGRRGRDPRKMTNDS
jgi:hypothetical protein